MTIESTVIPHIPDYTLVEQTVQELPGATGLSVEQRLANIEFEFNKLAPLLGQNDFRFVVRLVVESYALFAPGNVSYGSTLPDDNDGARGDVFILYGDIQADDFVIKAHVYNGTAWQVGADAITQLLTPIQQAVSALEGASFVSATAFAEAIAQTQGADEKNQPNGYAGLDAEGKIAASLIATHVQDYWPTAASPGASAGIAEGEFVRTLGFAQVGDGGGAIYKRVSAQPSHPGALQASDDAWFEYYADETGARRANVRAFGAEGNAVNAGTDEAGNWSGADDTAAFQNTELCAVAIGAQRYIPKGNFLVTGEITATETLGLQNSGDVRWYGDGDESVIIDGYLRGASDQMFGYIGIADATDASTVTLSLPASIGDDIITVNDASQLEVGQWLHLTNHSRPVWSPLTAGILGADGDLSTVADGIESVSFDFTTEPRFVVGEWIQIGGKSAWDRFDTSENNAYVRITAVAANKVTLADLPAGWAVDAGTDKKIRIWFRASRIAMEGDPVKIYSIDTDNDQVQLYQRLRVDLPSYAGVDGQGNHIGTTVRRFTAPISDVRFEDFKVVGQDNATNQSSKFCHVVRCIGFRAKRLTLDYLRSYGLHIQDCIDFDTNEIRANEIDLGSVPRYTIQSDGSCYGSVKDCRQFGGRHAVDGGSVDANGIESCYVDVIGNSVSGSYGAALGTHNGTRAWRFVGNVCDSIHLGEGNSVGFGMAGIQARGRQHIIKGNTISGFEAGVYDVYSDGQKTIGNTITHCLRGVVVDQSDGSSIYDNVMDDNVEADIFITSAQVRHSMSRLSIGDNKCDSLSPSLGGIVLEAGDLAWGTDWVLSGRDPLAATPFAQIEAKDRNKEPTFGGKVSVAGDAATDVPLSLKAATVSFPRHVLNVGSVGLSLNSALGELVRFRNDEVSFYGQLKLASYTVATLPAAGAAGRIIHVSDGDAGSQCLAVSDGGNWLRTTLGAAVSAS